MIDAGLWFTIGYIIGIAIGAVIAVRAIESIENGNN